MAVPTWFDKTAYFNNKLAQLGEGWDNLQLKAAFEAAGYAYTEEGLYQHFMDFGKTEGVSPTAWFDSSQYLYNKAAQFYDKTNVSANEVKSMDLAMEGAGMTPWDHFDRYWAEYYDTKGVFLNPSAGFDVTAYMNDKLALMQKDDPSYTMEMLIKAFQDAGLNPVEHYYVAGQAEGLAPKDSAIGATIAVGDEAVWGTNSNDYFTAGTGVLNDDTYIDGLGGNDTLYANIKVNGDTIAPHISNVETVLFRAQRADSNNVGNLTDAEIDAEFITGMKVLGSDNSRDSLKVEDVRIDSTDLTIRFSNSDPGDVDFSVYFDPQHLTREDSKTSGTLQIELMDVRNAQEHGKPLEDNPFDQFKFQYTDNTGKQQIVTLELGAIKGDATYDDLLAAFQNALKNAGLDGVISAKLDGNFSGQAMVGGTTYTSGLGQYIVLECSDGTIAVKNGSSAIDGTGWGVSTGTVPVTGGIVWDANNEGSATCPLIQTNVQLDNVGRVQWDDGSPCLPDDSVFGSEAGDLVIGSMAGRGGVERFDVTVDKGSWLSSLSSTNDALRLVTVKNGAVDGVNDHGNLFIGTPLEANGSDMELSNWMNAPRLLSTDGLTNVKVFDASEMVGKVNIGAQLTATALDKYMADVDGLNTMYNDYAPSGDFRYYLGHNDDTLNMKVNAGIAADRDFKLDIQTNAGNDLVNFTFEGLTGNRLLNQIALDNVSIDLGAGDDELWFWGNGAVKVNDGEGDDRVYVGQNADQNAVFVFGANSAAETFIQAGPDGAQPLGNEAVSTNQPALTLTGATAASYVTVTVTFNGISSEVTLNLKAGQTIIDMDTANLAIIEAINNDPTLSALLVAKDGMGNSLLVESLVDGQFANTDLSVKFEADATSGVTIGNGVYTPGGTNSALAQGGVEALDSALQVNTEGTAGAAEVQTLIVDALTSDEDYTIVWNGTAVTFTAGANATATVTALDTALTAGTGTSAITEVDGKWHITITAAANGVVSNDTVIMHGTPANVAGSDTGTTSMNTVDLTLGNDVIALNVGSAHNAFDTLVLNGVFGDDTVMGFDSTIDKLDVSALVSGGNHSGVGGAVGGAGNGALTVAEALASINGLTFAANEKGVALVLNSTSGDAHTYTVFQISNDGTAAVVADEVQVLGTLTVGDNGAIVTGDLLTA